MPLTKVTSGAITDSAITTAKIEDGTIVNADINASANIAQSKLSLSLPTISSITIQDSQGAIPPSDTSLYFDIIGTNFSNPSTVELLDSSTNASTNATTVTYVSATQLRVTASLSAGTYKIKVTRSDGFAGISATALLTVSQAVSWSTSAGSLGTFEEGIAISTITLSATSNSAVTYAVQSGSLPTGLSLNTSNGEITGTPGSISADTTSTFTVRATDAESQYADREFTITITDIVIFQSLRFNDGDSAYLSRTPSSATNRKTWTWSGWVKRGNINTEQYIFAAGENPWNNPSAQIYFLSSNELQVFEYTTGTEYQIKTNRLFRDVAAWYHIVVAFDTTESTSSDRIKIYVNGVQETSFSVSTYPSLNYDGVINNTKQHNIGSAISVSFFDGYMAECHFIDGQALTPSSFGTTGSNGRWKPKTYSGTYGTNGFYLDFADSSAFGDDESGNTNDFTATNLAATDKTTDTPQNNFATLNPLQRSSTSAVLSEGNCKLTNNTTANPWQSSYSTIGMNTGKWYWETRVDNQTSSVDPSYGIVADSNTQYQDNTYGNLLGQQASAASSYGISIYGGSGEAYYSYNGGFGQTSSFGGHNTGDIIGIAVDFDNEAFYYHVNGTYVNSGDPTSGSSRTGAIVTGFVNNQTWFAQAQCYNTNDAVSLNFGNAPFSISSGNADDSGYGNFEYAPPSGYKALCTNNLPESTIKDSSEHFNTVLYTGSGSARSITGVGFQPDWVWIKRRNGAYSHYLYDSSRGTGKQMFTNLTNAEQTDNTELTSFDSDGFSLGTGQGTNENTNTQVAWNWKAGGGTTSSNTDGSITSTVQVNTTAKFSIVTWTGNGTSGSTIGHGLGVTPTLVIAKVRNVGDNWLVYHPPGLTESKTLWMDSTDSVKVASTYYPIFWNSTDPTSSVITLGNNGAINGNGNTYVAYCFKDVEGFSKFGTYTGNGSTDGTFVYTGFKPTWFLAKRTDSSSHWTMLDGTRNSFNVAENYLHANEVNAENTNQQKVDFLSNGIKLRSISRHNDSGGTYFYMAFAESPFGGILTNEATAR